MFVLNHNCSVYYLAYDDIENTRNSNGIDSIYWGNCLLIFQVFQTL